MTQNDTKHKVVATQNINFYGFVDRDRVEWIIKIMIDILMNEIVMLASFPIFWDLWRFNWYYKN